MQFPDTMSYTGFFAPSRVEADVKGLQVLEGEIPKDMDGAFYRVQPDGQFPPKLGDDIAFNGDGMISMFRFKNGRADFKQRYAQTDKWKLEKAAGKALFGAYRNPLTDDQSVKGEIRGTANTNAYVFGGQLLALKEDSPALIMDLNTLETEGYTTFDGKMTGETFTAHPRIDPHTGNLCAFGYASKGICTDDMTYYEITPEGDLIREVWFKNKYYCMMHDFAITKDYACFHVVPSIGNWDRLEKGLPHFGFDTTMPVHMGILPRREGVTADDIRWFTTGNLFASHVMNAFQDGDKIHFDIPVSKNNPFPFFPDVHGEPFNPIEAMAYLTRWTFDMSSNSEEFSGSEKLSDMAGEFPRIDDRFTGVAYRYGWWLGMDMSKPVELQGGSAAGALMNTLALRDHKTGKEQHWWCGPVSSLQEPCFIPRKKDAPEGDGWIIQIENVLDQNTSDLLVFEALDIAKGPIARMRIPVRMRFGLHGNWADSDTLENAK